MIPTVIGGSPGTRDPRTLLELAAGLKEERFSRPIQGQAFLPPPMATPPTAMLFTRGKKPDKAASLVAERGGRGTERGIKVRRMHKALLRYHDPEELAVLRDTLKAHGPRGLDRKRAATILIRRTDPVGSKVRGGADESGTGRCPFEPSTPGLPKIGGAGPTAAGPDAGAETGEGRRGPGPRRACSDRRSKAKTEPAC